ncbi:Cyclin-C1-1 [Cardamine amara subsp. amara]|uniref:Cyclin-C1-1 n=1 Tax=Cardamine amara subsp. amara TaxID=228776 RepID=A0ABD1AL26_CARAN
MAANFWNSSHYKQLLDSEEVDDFKFIKFHMSNHIMKLAQSIKVRQRVVATAITYMRRVYIRKSMVEFEPRLVGLTCLYLASKAEESIVQARNLVFCIRKLYPDEYKYELKDILGMEMKVLEALNYYLVVFHPYQSLSEFLQDAAINDVNMKQITWGIVNDTYKMDLILVHPPYRIALACIYIASVHREKDITAWFEDLHEDMNLVKNIAMEILDFYENYRTITEERVNSAFSKLALKP